MSIMEEEILSEPSVLTHCYEANIAPVARLAAELKERGIRVIRIAARGSSNNACVYFKYLCEMLTDIVVSFVHPSTVTLYGAQLRGRDTCLLAVSQGGRGEDLRILTENAKANGVFTVSITNDSDSPLARLADTSLCMELPTELSMAATKSFSAELLLLDMLARSLSGRSMDCFRRLGSLLSEVAEVRINFFSFARELRSFENMFVMSRGLGLALAREACCKLQETCFVNATPYAVSDFMHGPFALVDKNTKVLLLAIGDESLESNREMARKLREQGAALRLITDDEALFDEFGGLLLARDEDLSIYSFAMAVQLICSRLSNMKGLNPDTSRNLNKYTVTV